LFHRELRRDCAPRAFFPLLRDGGSVHSRRAFGALTRIGCIDYLNAISGAVRPGDSPSNSEPQRTSGERTVLDVIVCGS